MSVQIGNAPCSWGSLEFEGLAGKSVGYAQMLDELAATGYKGTELGDWGYMPTSADALAAELRSRALTMVGAFVPVNLKDEAAHHTGAVEAVKIAQLLADAALANGQDTRPVIVLADANGADPARTRFAGRATPAMALSPAEWNRFAHGAEQVARAVHDEAGLQTVFHHHCAGYVETPDEIAELLARTDPTLLGLVFDTGHYLYGSGSSDPQTVLEGLERFGERIRHMHFKDCHPAVAAQARSEGWDYFTAVRHGIFCELGQGSVAFAQVKRWLEERGYQGWIIVEQDVLPGLGSPRASAQRNREYLRTIGL